MASTKSVLNKLPKKVALVVMVIVIVAAIALAAFYFAAPDKFRATFPFFFDEGTPSGNDTPPLARGDGELQEGSVWESFMNGAHHKLDNLVAIIDRNGLQIDGATENIKSLEPLNEKIKAFGWDVLEVDGHDIPAIYDTIEKAKQNSKPTAIIANTIKGKGVSFMENNAGWHGKATNQEEFEKAMKELE